jgi:hypothetical protein
MGEAGHQRFLAHFTLDRMHAQLTNLYQRLRAQGGAVAADARSVCAQQGGSTHV